jgi:L-amino acid N-acyltransferase YncA
MPLLKLLPILRTQTLSTLWRLASTRLSQYHYVLYGLDFGRRPARMPRRELYDSPIVTQRGTVAALQEWRRTRPSVPLPFLRDQTDDLTTFWWALDESRIAAILWMAQRSRLVRLAPREVVLVDAYTDPGYRRKGLCRLLIQTACDDLAADHIRAAYATITPDNIASMLAFEQAGFTRLGTFSTSWYRRPQRQITASIHAQGVDESLWAPGAPHTRLGPE